MDAHPSLVERRDGPALPAGPGLVRFEDVSFGYDPVHPILRGFDLTLRPGETVALVGASGAGKTTVVSLLLNYYDAESGRVTIDGQDVRDYDPPSIRRQIAAVLQERMLFQTSVRENLRYGRLDATDAEIEAAAVVARADGFMRELADGYDTQVGPRGVRLSGGQRQRLAIARAVLKNPPLPCRPAWRRGLIRVLAAADRGALVNRQRQPRAAARREHGSPAPTASGR